MLIAYSFRFPPLFQRRQTKTSLISPSSLLTSPTVSITVFSFERKPESCSGRFLLDPPLSDRGDDDVSGMSIIWPERGWTLFSTPHSPRKIYRLFQCFQKLANFPPFDCISQVSEGRFFSPPPLPNPTRSIPECVRWTAEDELCAHFDGRRWPTYYYTQGKKTGEG